MNRSRWISATLDTVQLSMLWIALIFGVAAMGMAAYEAWFLHRAVAATGTVVSIDVHEQTDGNAVTVFYAPVFTFHAAGGDVTVHSHTAGSEGAYRIGQSVRVRYPADAPERAQIEGVAQQWALAIAFGTAAAACGVVGGVLRLRRGARGFPMYLFEARAART